MHDVSFFKNSKNCDLVLVDLKATDLLPQKLPAIAFDQFHKNFLS